MANSTSHTLPYPILNARYTLPLTFRVAAGTPTDPTTPDTEFSTDGGASFSDCAEEITTGGSNGCGYLTLTSTETNNSLLFIAGKSANDVTTPAIVQPRRLAIVGSGTLSAGSAGGGTLGTLLAYDVTGCFIRTTGGTGGGGANNQARRIITYNTGSGAFTVSPNWETTPSTDTTYDVLLPEGVTLGMLKSLNPTTAGRTLDVSSGGEAGVDWDNVGSPTATLALTNTTIATTQKVDVETIKTQSVTAANPVTVLASVGTAATSTAQTGDSFARIGAPAGASVSADLLVIDNLVDDLEARLGTPSNLGSGATVAANLVDIEGQTDDIGVAGAGLTALGDTRVANLDATVSSRMATYTQPTGFLAATFPGGTIANTTNITAGTIDLVSAPNATALQAAADAFLNRNVAGGSSTGRLVKHAFAKLRNKWDIYDNGGTPTMRIYDTDDTTVIYEEALSTDVSTSDVVTGADPTT